MLTRWARSFIALGVVACSNSGEDPAASTVRPMDGTDTKGSDASESDAPNTETLDGDAPESDALDSDVPDSETPDSETPDSDALNGETPDSDAPNCSDGDTRVCVGSGACVGGQRCEDGEWGECDCGENTQGGNTAAGGPTNVGGDGPEAISAPVGVGSGGDTNTTPGGTTPSISSGGATPNPNGGGGGAVTPSSSAEGGAAAGGAGGSPSPSPSGSGGEVSNGPWIEVPLVVGETGRVELGSNSVGIQGEWAQDAYLSCTNPNEPTSIPSYFAEPPVPDESGAYCVYGTWAQFCSEFNALYFSIGDDDPLTPYEGYDAIAHGVVGFAFDFTSNVETAGTNLNVFANSSANRVDSRSRIHFFTAETVGTQRAYILWTEGSLFPTDSEMEWSASTFSGLSFNFLWEANTPFDFCLSNLMALVDPNH